MRRMHERQNIGKVILLPETKKEEEKPKSDPEPVENVEKTEAAVNEKKEEATEEVKAEKDWVRVFILNDIFKHILNEFPFVQSSKKGKKREEKHDAMNSLTLSVFSNVYEDLAVQYVYSVVSMLGILVF